MTLHLQEGKQIELNSSKPFAVVAITKHGVELARHLHATFQQTDLFYMSKFEQGDEDQRRIQLFEGNVRMLLPALFSSYKGIIVIISLGAVVRMIAPLLKDKKTDPAVVVIDDKGKHVISVLSGHLGGANELTRELADHLKATPVITTASDVQQTIPVDLFGQKFGWVWESSEKLTPVSAAVVNEEPVAIIQESGERNWWNYKKPLPNSLTVYKTFDEAIAAKPNAALIISHRILTEKEEELLQNGVLYRPKVIVLGIGCNRGTSMEEIEAVILSTLEELRFSVKSVKDVCSITLKQDEAGILALAQKYQWPFTCYSPEQLNSVKIKNPSDTVYKFTGAYGVSEPAALLHSGADSLILTKKKSGNVTLSVALITHS
ncbi:cobalt-precorrin 5A hydrolase [Bacillus weihaiensis]|uniref:Cobalamin biosynthesis protein CbiG n=1 Tax=Bacillus weihaiensis TaxID=1547283 RepID=A0A1L3MRU5_9BACI|nr:cobalt-precorrin 5A hydrolase [Bacillus weihaiensis]APH05072.1 cobalamin biosynthesis protein CbiG [Bacillus weihaiensis]